MGVNLDLSFLEKTLNEEIDKIAKEIAVKHASKMTSIKSELYGLFRSIIISSYKKRFNELYGNDYDEQSLENSLIFTSGKSLLPDFTYNAKTFKFNKSINNNLRKFNLNSQSISTISEIRDIRLNPKNFDLIEEFLDDNSENEDEEDEVLEYIATNFVPTSKRGIQDSIMNVEDAYRDAKQYAIEEFNKQYTSVIKPRILRKYGIKLG